MKDIVRTSIHLPILIKKSRLTKISGQWGAVKKDIGYWETNRWVEGYLF